MKGSEFVFDCVQLLHYKYNKINPNHSGSYIDSPGWIKSKKTTINPINKCFQYAVTVVLNYEEKKDPQKITKVKPFVNKYNWEGINFPSENDDWKKIVKNKVTITFNVLYAQREKIYLAYVWKYNSNCEKQVIPLMVSNGEKWHYLTIKKLSALLIGTTSKNNDDFYFFELSSFL